MSNDRKELRHARNATKSFADVNAAKLLRDALLKKGWTRDTDLFYMEVKGGTHDEESFMKRAAPMLKFLFGRRVN